MPELKLRPEDATVFSLLRNPIKPSIPELAEILGRVKSWVFYRLKALDAAGYIVYDGSRERSTVLTEKGEAVLPELITVIENEDGVLERAEPPFKKWKQS